MKCKVDGCYARPYRKNLCHAHYAAWMLNTSFDPSARSGKQKGDPPSTPAATCQHEPELIVWWNCYQCRKCGMPLKEAS